MPITKSRTQRHSASTIAAKAQWQYGARTAAWNSLWERIFAEILANAGDCDSSSTPNVEVTDANT
jgi:hypothetical protein